jgi:hypothetical protein
MADMVYLVLPVAVLIIAVAVLTGQGASKRGAGVQLAVLSGLMFPITWVVWYIHDEQPYTH